MISSGIFFLVVVYMLHATCRPHIPIAARALILASTAGVVYWWFNTRTAEEQEGIIRWVPAHRTYLILSVVAIAALMVLWAMHLRRDEDRQSGAAAEGRRSGSAAQVNSGLDPKDSKGPGPGARLVDPLRQGKPQTQEGVRPQPQTPLQRGIGALGGSNVRIASSSIVASPASISSRFSES